MISEVWRDVLGYEGLYQVSNLGRVKSLSRKAGYVFLREKIMKPTLGKNGYFSVILSFNMKTKRVYIHRLVAEAFVPNPNGYSYVNHKDECKTNNVSWNLEWCTHNYNLNYGTHNKRLSESKKDKHTKPILQLTTDGSVVKEWDSIKEAAKQNGLRPCNISAVLHGYQTTCGGFKWRFA